MGFLTGASAGAAPFPSVPDPSGAKDDTAYTFTTSASGGSGGQEFSFKLPGPGVYLATFAANFIATGSAASPVAFTCLLTYGSNKNVAQATAISEGDLGWNVALTGAGIVAVKKGHLTLEATCGTGNDSTWTFADRPLEVTFVKLAGQVKGSLVNVLAVQNATAGTTR
jgi:hypothetical protein